MLKYFRDLLAVLKSIDARLARLESCVTTYGRNHSNGYKPHIRTGHWND
jgi:hypothetical protein